MYCRVDLSGSEAHRMARRDAVLYYRQAFPSCGARMTASMRCITAAMPSSMVKPVRMDRILPLCSRSTDAEPEELLRAPFGSCVNLLGYVPDGTDYLLFRGSDGKDRIYAVRGAELTSVMTLNREQAEIAAFCCVQGERGFVFQIDDQTFYRADADGVEQLLLPEGNKLWSVLPAVCC